MGTPIFFGIILPMVRELDNIIGIMMPHPNPDLEGSELEKLERHKQRHGLL